ncbi:heparinase II/III family protein [Clostridium sp.]|uniref:heparinase II/III family protein n=1 Tax=Clostridium sp. TaxID=1506 RepID=UPI0026016D6E|nr:heparinase II/III family protein [Clostridium sp.]
MSNYIRELTELKSNIKNYMNEYDLEFVKCYINNICKESLKKKIIGANLILNNSFLFDDEWDMEQCNIPYLNKDLDWSFTPNGDEEWVFMLNRHEYFEKLLIAYYVKEDEKYIDKLKELIFNWIENNEIKISGGQTIRTIDTGIRCGSWLKVLLHLVNEDKLSDDEILKIVLSMKEQLEYLRKLYVPKYILSNWGVLQTTSIVYCYLWLKDFINDEELFKWGLNELYKEIEIQVLEDGSHWEQSIMYHIEVLNCSMTTRYYANYFNFDLDKKFLRKIHLMAKYLVYCGDANSLQESQGDSDRSDIRDVLVKASILFNDPKLKFRAHNEVDLSTIFLFGKSGFIKYINIEKVEIKTLNKSFIDSGNIYIRSGWDEKASFTYLQNGTLGSGHGHSDLCHFSIHYGGKPFLVDTGRYTYVESDVLREYLKSAKAHNVSVIDDSPFAIPKNSWQYEKYPDVMKNYFCEKDNVSYSEIYYLATLDDETPYVVIRKVLVISPCIWIVVNDIRCKGKHTCKNYYNLDNQVKIYEEEDYFKCVNSESEIKIYNNNVQEKIISNGLISKHYNSINNNKKIVTKTAFENNLVNYDMILGQGLKNIEIRNPNILQYNSKEKIEENMAIIKEFIIDENESYTVVIFNRETFKGAKIYMYNDVAIYGKVVVIHKFNGRSEVIRLKS